MSMQGCTQGRMRNRMNADMEKRFTPLMRLYHNEIPGLLQELYETPPLCRLADVGMHCGCDYSPWRNRRSAIPGICTAWEPH